MLPPKEKVVAAEEMYTQCVLDPHVVCALQQPHPQKYLVDIYDVPARMVHCYYDSHMSRRFCPRSISFSKLTESSRLMAFPSAGPVDISALTRVAKDDLGLTAQPKAIGEHET